MEIDTEGAIRLELRQDLGPVVLGIYRLALAKEILDEKGSTNLLAVHRNIFEIQPQVGQFRSRLRNPAMA